MRVVRNNPVSKVLCSKDSRQPLFVIDNEHTVRSLGGAQLTGIGDGDVLRDCESWAGLECSDRALCGRVLCGLLAEGERGGCSAFSGEFRFDLFTNGL